MHWIDWSIVGCLVAALVAATLYTKKYTRSVADFLAANRCARRYLISVAQVMAGGMGTIGIIAYIEMYYQGGFTTEWWIMLQTLALTVAGISGWILYRFRETRSLTFLQFVEMRYSKNLRKLMGVLAWVSGVANFGIFPAVSARFFLYFCNFPNHVSILGLAIPTHTIIVITLVSAALFFTFISGQISVMVADFLQGVFCSIVLIAVFLVLMHKFSWEQITQALSMAPEKASLLHPFKTTEAKDFTIWFYILFGFNVFYCDLVWQGSQGYNVCAINAHEARMGNLLKGWRYVGIFLFMLTTSVCAYTFLHHPDFAGQAEEVKAIIANMTNTQIQKQQAVTVAARFFLPTGMLGLLTATMLAGFIANHNTYLHSWGSIMIQDVILPFRKKHFEPKHHILLLRLSILLVAVIIVLWSILYREIQYIWMYFELTGAIFLGGAGSVVIGGLYWKRGTTLAAWFAMIFGTVFSVGGIVLQQIEFFHPGYLGSLPVVGGVLGFVASKNGMILGFYAAVLAILIYVATSLFGWIAGKEAFNMDKMLHRGQYAIEETEKIKAKQRVTWLRALIGMGSEFKFRDKVIYIVTISWSVFWVLVFIVGTIYNLTHTVKIESWIKYWKCYIWIMFSVSVITAIWFTIGGFSDMKKMFDQLNKIKMNDLDDGTVLKDNNQEK